MAKIELESQNMMGREALKLGISVKGFFTLRVMDLNILSGSQVVWLLTENKQLQVLCFCQHRGVHEKLKGCTIYIRSEDVKLALSW